MSTRLVILGLLKEQPLHGYDLKKLIQERMGDWTDIAFGSIYFALGKMEEEGFIAKVATEKSGNRPSRSIYEITKKGETEFLRLLEEVWAKSERVYHPLDLGLFFMNVLPREDVVNYLEMRVAWLEAACEHVAEHKTLTMSIKEVPRRVGAIFDHNVVHLQAELEWTRQVLENVQAGRY